MDNKLEEYHLDFIPNASTSLLTEINGEVVKLELKYIYPKDGEFKEGMVRNEVQKWALFINEVIELTDSSFVEYADLFEFPLRFLSRKDANVLVVGGGDLQLIYHIYHGLTSKEYVTAGINFTVIDPLIAELKHMLYSVSYFGKVNSFMCHYSSVNTVPHTFDFVAKNKKLFNISTYDMIIVDVSDESFEAPKDIYTEDFVSQCYKLLNENGLLVAYSGVEDKFNHMEESFNLKPIYDKKKYIKDFKSDAIVRAYLKE